MASRHLYHHTAAVADADGDDDVNDEDAEKLDGNQLQLGERMQRELDIATTVRERESARKNLQARERECS